MEDEIFTPNVEIVPHKKTGVFDCPECSREISIRNRMECEFCGAEYSLQIKQEIPPVSYE